MRRVQYPALVIRSLPTVIAKLTHYGIAVSSIELLAVAESTLLPSCPPGIRGCADIVQRLAAPISQPDSSQTFEPDIDSLIKQTYEFGKI